MHTREPAIPSDAWVKSSYSGANTSECVETAAMPRGTAVRDSKRPVGPRLSFSHSAWSGFVTALQEGELG
ncbi:DUF397 domain-containing protein [Streptomyces sp. NPDC003016]